jgi:hypothetical protein
MARYMAVVAINISQLTESNKYMVNIKTGIKKTAATILNIRGFLNLGFTYFFLNHPSIRHGRILFNHGSVKNYII